MTFTEQLAAAWQRNDSLLCVGLDPDPGKLPLSMTGTGGAIFSFCREIVDATADLVCAFKPQIAYFAAQRAEDQLEQLIAYIHDAHPGIPVILDAKRGDIGSTAQQYAIEAFERYRADAVTVNPYMGLDSLEPYLAYPDRGVIVLCRTSNPGGSDVQFLPVDGKPVYQVVAEAAATRWNTNGQMALVVGATFPAEIAKVREIVGDMPLLIPGIGAQGGDIEATVRAGRTGAGAGMMINSSRAILYASREKDFAAAARNVALQTREIINRFPAAIRPPHAWPQASLRTSSSRPRIAYSAAWRRICCRSPRKRCVSILVVMRLLQPKHTMPTGFSGVPPVGPATPVIDSATWARLLSRAPSAMARATSSLTAP
ncbi:orotidine 5'-phosphate decarboxylase [Cupriavidus basilensis OR16]|uniref:Orotidine 5'-phosphate decarboxylase n=1 Tax=Cupriavidus basilensis OR16 TaxID=1127483 RepID=H1SE42_9BURK|nr:orotidine 5'-phosphate decarboxylase [Cupriavidus basilensis OR16]